MYTMVDVLSAFQQLTGQEFYPHPTTFSVLLPNGGTVGEAVDKVDDIIAAQAKHRGINHGPAQADTITPLCEMAEASFEVFKSWSNLQVA